MLTGAILAGGESRRFGRNKALEEFQGKRLIEWGLESLRRFCDPLLVVANDLSLYYDVQATLVQDIIPRQGPLGGIYTALLFSTHDWVMVKATDMPFLVPELLNLMEGLKEGADAVVPLYNNKYEPLLAVYHRRCIPAIADVLEGTERKVVSFYRRIKLRALDEDAWRSVDKDGRSFWNINTLEDWEQLQWN